MSLVRKKSKSAKKQSRFQQLWDQAEKLKQSNERKRSKLDRLVQRLQVEVFPIELESCRESIPLLKRLLVLAQRKSLCGWERDELNDWILELIEPLLNNVQIDPELDAELHRYRAFCCGLKLDEESGESFEVQIERFLQQQHEAQAAAEEEILVDDTGSSFEREIERRLDAAMGQAPPPPAAVDDSADLFAEDLNTAQQQAYDEYQQRRAELRKQWLAEFFGMEDESRFDENDYFDFDEEGFNEFEASRTPPQAAISNEVFTRLFRATAAVLHPDRQQDTSKQEHNHQLMSQLLKARKAGDVMTIIELHQQHVGDDAGLSNQDEKQLISALQQQIENLNAELEDYRYSSPLHELAFERFYFASAKKTDQAIQQHIENVKHNAIAAQAMARDITSVKKLKPYLSERYEEYRMDYSFDALAEAFSKKDPFGFGGR